VSWRTLPDKSPAHQTGYFGFGMPLKNIALFMQQTNYQKTLMLISCRIAKIIFSLYPDFQKTHIRRCKPSRLYSFLLFKD
jgi:hypothetical protein